MPQDQALASSARSDAPPPYIMRLEERGRMQAKRLAVTDLAVSREGALSLNVSPGADRVELYVCEAAVGERCVRQVQPPQTFAGRSMRLAEQGALHVAVRACVIRQRALDPQNLCGPWEQVSTRVAARDELGRPPISTHAQCREIEDALRDYRRVTVAATPRDEDNRFDDLVANYLGYVSPEACMAYNGSAMMAAIKRELEAQLAPPWAMLLAPGSAAVLAALAVSEAGFAAELRDASPRVRRIAAWLERHSDKSPENIAALLRDSGMLKSLVRASKSGIDVLGMDTGRAREQHRLRQILARFAARS